MIQPPVVIAPGCWPRTPAARPRDVHRHMPMRRVSQALPVPGCRCRPTGAFAAPDAQATACEARTSAGIRPSLPYIHANAGDTAMATPVKELQGINDTVLSALTAQDINDNLALVEAAATPAARKALAADCGVSASDLLELVNRADLARINGVSGVYSDLLEEAGVDTVKELATRRPDNLHAKLLETNEVKSITQRPPTAAQVEDWVEQAKALPKIVTY
jgi:predicted flap endonuclease-1-like 5' DNA nuclease